MIDFSSIKKLTIGGIELKQLFINGIQVWKSGYKNWVRYSTDADGVTIYNGGLGYKQEHRVRSGGAETSQGGATCTGFIKVDPGDVIRVSGCPFSEISSANAINASDSSFTNLGQLTPSYSVGYGIFADSANDYSWNSVVEEKTGVWRWVVPPASFGIAYIRLTGKTYDGSSLILTRNEEIE